MIWMRNSGIRTVALVTRVVERKTGDSDKWRAPVVAFTDDRGVHDEHEIRTNHDNPPRPGTTVSVIYRPGGPRPSGWTLRTAWWFLRPASSSALSLALRSSCWARSSSEPDTMRRMPACSRPGWPLRGSPRSPAVRR